MKQKAISETFRLLNHLQHRTIQSAFYSIFDSKEATSEQLAKTTKLVSDYRKTESEYFDATYFITSFYPKLSEENKKKVVNYFVKNGIEEI